MRRGLVLVIGVVMDFCDVWGVGGGEYGNEG